MPLQAMPDMPAADTPPKRGPGRPKGSKNKPKNPVDQVAADLRGNQDTPPSGGTRRKRINKKTTEAIEDALAEIFCAPAMGTAIVGDEWATEHFTKTGHELAHRIAVTSERHSQLRIWCEKALDSESIVVLGLAVTAYTIPPLIHWNIIPGPDNMMGVPRRPSKRRPHKPTESPTEATEWQTETTEQQRYEAARNMDTSSGAQFSDDDEAEPPTFIETPV